jgi:zinc finger protein
MSEEEVKATPKPEEGEEGDHLNFNEWTGVDQMESLCMSCGETGVTRFLLHKIPRFRELVIASFFCEHCGERNNEVTFGGEIQEKACVYELTVTTERDINRQIVKSDSASIYIRELDFEIPAGTQKGSINTLEGVFKRAIDDLSALQPLRMIQTPEVGAKVAEIIDSLQEIASGNRLPFHIRLDDPAGNSFIENPVAPALDPMLTVHYYQRSADQDRSLGLDPDQENFKKAQIDHSDEIMEGRKVFGGEVGQTAPTATSSEQDGETVEALGKTEVISIPSLCPSCHKEGESLTALTNIPHFKEVIIMSFTCKFCGQRTSDVKAGGAVPTYGTEVRLLLTSEEDMKR